MTNLVPSLATCLKLDEVGYPMNTEFRWVEWNCGTHDKPEFLTALSNERPFVSWDHNGCTVEVEHREIAPAPTLGELLEEMGEGVSLSKDPYGWWCSHFAIEYPGAILPVAVEAAAEMWLRKEGKE